MSGDQAFWLALAGILVVPVFGIINSILQRKYVVEDRESAESKSLAELKLVHTAVLKVGETAEAAKTEAQVAVAVGNSHNEKLQEVMDAVASDQNRPQRNVTVSSKDAREGGQ